MVSAAVGAEDFYSVEEHSARFEGLELARERDRRAMEAWEMHPYVDIVDNRGNFDSKVSKYDMNRVIISSLAQSSNIFRNLRWWVSLIQSFPSGQNPGLGVSLSIQFCSGRW